MCAAQDQGDETTISGGRSLTFAQLSPPSAFGPGWHLRCWCSAADRVGFGPRPPLRQAGQRPAPAGAAAPADYRSTHFLLHTDLPSKDAQALLKRLETMLDLISRYWARQPVGIIECYVVRDLAKWPAGTLHPDGLAKIAEGAGVTLTATYTVPGPRGTRKPVSSKSVVYASADHGTPEHEAVHAYCGQTFGAMGPLWYAEGMAEMGQYWEKDDPSVHIEPVVLRYLQTSQPQSLRDIVETKSARSFTGDSWQNYAWRWALCHLLSNNTNYRDRFRPLGLGFLTGERVSFESTYGAMADEIAFEYLFFLEHIDQGFRADLCSWDWKKKGKPLFGGTPVTAKILAARGWQPSGIACTAGQKYDFATSGTWQTGPAGKEIDADGRISGEGRLVGVLMQDFALGEPFDLGSYGTFAAPTDGHLYLRCQDAWNRLADNKGAVTVKLKLAGQGTPLVRTKGEAPSVLGEASPAIAPAPKSDSPRPGTAETSVLGQARPATDAPPKPGPIPPPATGPASKLEPPHPADAAPPAEPWPPKVKRQFPLPGPPAPS